jgi:hypothetical protein
VRIPLATVPATWPFLAAFAANCTRRRWLAGVTSYAPLNALMLPSYDALAQAGVPAAIQSSAMVAAFDTSGQAAALRHELDAVAAAGQQFPVGEPVHPRRPAGFAHHGPARSPPNPGLVGVGAVRAARDAEPEPDGACGLAATPGPVSDVVLTFPAVIGAVAARIPIRIQERFGAPSRDERRNVYGRVCVVDTLPVLVHGCPLMAELNRCAHVPGLLSRRAGSMRAAARAWPACTQLGQRPGSRLPRP